MKRLLSLSLILAALFGAFAAAAQSPLRYGDSVIGELAGPESSALYAFVAQAGDVITATMNSLEGGLDPFLILTDGERRRVLAVDDDSGGNTNARLRAIIMDRGTYLLLAVMSPKGNGARGRYELRLTLNNPPFTPGPLAESPRLMPLPAGGGARADLSPTVPTRWYALYARSGEVITVEAEPEGGLRTALALYTVEGSALSLVAAPDSGPLRAAAPREGWYWVAITSVGDSPSGVYTVRRAAPPAASAPLPTLSAPPAPAGIGLVSGLPVRGEGGAGALYHFSGLAGGLITLSAGGEWVIVLADAAFRQLAVGVSAVRAQLPADGLYYALLLPSEGITAQTGYSVILSGAFSPTATPPPQIDTTPVALAYGAQAERDLSQQTPLAYFSFQGKRGDPITIRAEAVDGPLDPALYLYSYESGRPALIAANDNADPGTTTAALSFALPADGPYLIAVTGVGLSEGAAGGRFRLSLSLAISK